MFFEMFIIKMFIRRWYPYPAFHLYSIFNVSPAVYILHYIARLTIVVKGTMVQKPVYRDIDRLYQVKLAEFANVAMTTIEQQKGYPCMYYSPR